MRKQFWFSIAVTAGIAIGNCAAVAQPRVEPQTETKRPVIFGVPAQRPNPAPTPAPAPVRTQSPAPRAPHAPVLHNERDRRHDRDWYRDHHREREHHYRHHPAGWDKGRKTGWGEHHTPPGQAKKADWREHDRDHRGNGKGHKR